ncbi:M48 family metallopeptidase [Ectobacillus ponti]|uniref:M48 family metallopeptidase n=1 Tax=Ectobacillus ponti TaxID=2961894 RepID=A0AA42BSA0_9BACI|nr:M48 family metallopeptidase [Ectobacillus ponti]MCP8968233.1 M48 family metallopeptidase [Ectobacillus ponti]
MRKAVSWSILAYLCFGAFMYWYLFYGTSGAIPAEFKGTSADPATFMNSRELLLSQEYSRTKYLLFFLSTPFEWLVLLLLLVLGISRRFEASAEAVTKLKVGQAAIYMFYLSLLTTVLALPFKWIGYQVSKSYNISTQTTGSWIKDLVTDYWVNFAITLLVVTVLMWLIRKSQKRWWLYAWALSVPFTLFLTFIQPVIIDPLYNDFTPLKNKQLEQKILSMAERANIPAEHVYEVDMSAKTNALNAYVTGIGANSRIVLWDTTLNQLKEPEILFIMAHEMAHYVYKHIYWGVASYIVLSFVGLYLISRLVNAMLTRWRGALQIPSIQSLSAVPLIFLISSVLSFAVSPAENYVSRMEERAADQYAIAMTKNNDAAVETFQDLSKTSLSQVNPPALVKLFLYTHPTILERIDYLDGKK